MGNLTTNLTSPTNVDENNGTATNLNYGYLTLSVVPFTAVFGNILVIVCVVLNRHLKQHLTNRIIASLAFCDLAVGLLVMPFAILLKVGSEFLTNQLGHIEGEAMNILLKITKILCSGIPCRIPMQSILIAVPVVAAQSTVDLERCSLQNAHYMIYSSMLSFYIPAAALAFLYIKLFQRLKRRERFREAMKQFSSLAHMVKSTFPPPAAGNEQDGVVMPAAEKALPASYGRSAMNLECQKDSHSKDYGYKFSVKTYYDILANCDGVTKMSICKE
uniref:G-protein coupled receptors family 1 profile domain-containing protein n=1 Tax=Romanomermis culicivorax TaxID=13658 RepID=A0A915KU27_ROMCU